MTTFRNSTAAGRVKAAADRLAAAAARVGSAPAPDAPARPADGMDADRIPFPSDLPQLFLPLRGAGSAGRSLLYRPALLGTARVRFLSPKEGIDQTETVALLAPLRDDLGEAPWGEAETLADAEPVLERTPDPSGRFAPLPSVAARSDSDEIWGRGLSETLRRTRSLTILTCRTLDLTSKPGESEAEFRSRLGDEAGRRRHEEDVEAEALRGRTEAKIAALRGRLRSAAEPPGFRSPPHRPGMLRRGLSTLAALLGRDPGGAGPVPRGGTATRRPGSAPRPEAETTTADTVETMTRQLAALEAELRSGMARRQAEIDPAADPGVEKMILLPAKGDIEIVRVALVWTPWRVDPDGNAQPAFR